MKTSMTVDRLFRLADTSNLKSLVVGDATRPTLLHVSGDLLVWMAQAELIRRERAARQRERRLARKQPAQSRRDIRGNVIPLNAG